MTAPTAADRRRALRRAADRERQAAVALGTQRVRRGRGSAPDVKPVLLPNGGALGPEVKTRKRLPRLLVDALEQARRYFRGCVPIAIVSERGGGALVVLELAAFVRLVGVDVPLVSRLRGRRRERQLDLFGAEREAGGHGGHLTVHVDENPDGPVKAAGCLKDAPPAAAARTSTPPPAARQGASAAGRRSGIEHRDPKPDNTRRATR